MARSVATTRHMQETFNDAAPSSHHHHHHHQLRRTRRCLPDVLRAMGLLGASPFDATIDFDESDAGEVAIGLDVVEHEVSETL